MAKAVQTMNKCVACGELYAAASTMVEHKDCAGKRAPSRRVEISAGKRGGKMATLAIQLRDVVRRGRQVFQEVGEALIVIHDRKLYIQLGHKSFKGYCEAEGVGRSYAYEAMEGRKAGRLVAPSVRPSDTRIGSRESRELVKARKELGDEAVQEVWEEAGPEPTAKTIRKAVQQRLASGEVEQPCAHPRATCDDCGEKVRS